MKTQAILLVLALLPLVLGGCAQPEKNPYEGDIVICLDAGHGGNASGAVLDQRLEKDDNLAMTLAVGSILESRGAKVIYTRSDDTDVELQNRAAFANKMDASMFVSFHRNAGGGQGAEVWIDKSPDRWEKSLATRIQSVMARVGFTDRGVKRGTAGNSTINYTVIGRTQMPACLIELGFIDNEADNDLLDTYWTELAEGIAEAILQEAGLAQ